MRCPCTVYNSNKSVYPNELFYFVKPRDSTQDAMMQADELKKVFIKMRYKQNFHTTEGIARDTQQRLPYSSFDEWMEALEKARNLLVDPPFFWVQLRPLSMMVAMH